MELLPVHTEREMIRDDIALVAKFMHVAIRATFLSHTIVWTTAYKT